MRIIIVGYGVQGRKRRSVASADVVAIIDPAFDDADYSSVEDVPVDSYDAAIVCTPEAPKFAILKYLLGAGKHVLVEKPLSVGSADDIDDLQAIAARNGTVCSTAYNHRFEPHIRSLQNLIASDRLGQIYRCRMLYGNGTARDVRDSEWRDQGAGVLIDLGSHLLDLVRFLFPERSEACFRIVSADRFENRAPDHVVIVCDAGYPRIELEMTFLMWRNTFACDVLGETGTAHIESLCKWGPSKFTVRDRVLPSGRPPERSETLIENDPTWELEYADFISACKTGRPTDLSGDRWLKSTLDRLSRDIET